MYGRLKRYGRWGELREEAELLAMKADSLVRIDPAQSRELYQQAAVKEEEALAFPPSPDKPGLQLVYQACLAGAAALYYKAGDYVSARRIIAEHGDKIEDGHCKGRLEEVVAALDEQN